MTGCVFGSGSGSKNQTLEFETNGGSAVATISQRGGSVIAPNNPIKEGVSFVSIPLV